MEKNWRLFPISFSSSFFFDFTSATLLSILFLIIFHTLEKKLWRHVTVFFRLVILKNKNKIKIKHQMFVYVFVYFVCLFVLCILLFCCCFCLFLKNKQIINILKILKNGRFIDKRDLHGTCYMPNCRHMHCRVCVLTVSGNQYRKYCYQLPRLCTQQRVLAGRYWSILTPRHPSHSV